MAAAAREPARTSSGLVGGGPAPQRGGALRGRGPQVWKPVAATAQVPAPPRAPLPRRRRPSQCRRRHQRGLPHLGRGGWLGGVAGSGVCVYVAGQVRLSWNSSMAWEALAAVPYQVQPPPRAGYREP